MDYENFKEELIEGLKENFEARGIEGMSFRDQGQVNKLNGGYDGVVVTPQDSAIGVGRRTIITIENEEESFDANLSDA